MFEPIQWWGYLHQNGTVQLKRYLGDPRDYTDDCEGNEFVLRVVRPFVAESRQEALMILTSKLGIQQEKPV